MSEKTTPATSRPSSVREKWDRAWEASERESKERGVSDGNPSCATSDAAIAVSREPGDGRVFPNAARISAVLGLALFLASLIPVASCAASLEQTAREELEERGYHEVTLQPLKRSQNAFSFEGTTDGEACQGEIELQQEMGETLATVTSQCGDE